VPTFRRKKRPTGKYPKRPSKYPKRPSSYTTPCSEFLTGRNGHVSVACLEGWRALFDYIESKQDMIDVRNGLTAILEDDDDRSGTKVHLSPIDFDTPTGDPVVIHRRAFYP